MKLTERLREHNQYLVLRDDDDCIRGMELTDEWQAALRIERLEAALRSIAANTCCDNCQEAATVARAALAEEGT